MKISSPTPKELGYYFPAEFELHAATWLSWPHKEASWPGKIELIFAPYCLFIKILAEHEPVHINIVDENMKAFAMAKLEAISTNMENVRFYTHPTNDAWCRDHGPAFLINPSSAQPKIIIDWNYNAWGNKYPPYDLDEHPRTGGHRGNGGLLGGPRPSRRPAPPGDDNRECGTPRRVRLIR